MKTLNAKQKAKNTLVWIKELLTTEEKQGISQLGNSSMGYCCLGLGCKVLNVGFKASSGYPKNLTAHTGLLNNKGEAEVPLIGTLDSLANLNDDGVEFKKIGNIIYKKRKHLFESEVVKEIDKLTPNRLKDLK